MCGFVSRTWRTARPASRSKTPDGVPRSPSTHVVPVVRVMIGCIEYAGVNPSAVRPTPPNAWTRWSSTSLEPLPAHTCVGATGTPVWERRYAARASRSSVNSRSGYRLR